MALLKRLVNLPRLSDSKSEVLTNPLVTTSELPLPLRSALATPNDHAPQLVKG